MKKLYLSIFSMLLLSAVYGQHPAIYTQYMFNGLVINPAYTGSRNVLSIASDFRMQWVGFKGAPRTFTFSAHSPLKDPRSNIGLMVYNDRLGVSNQTGVFGYYAFRLKLGPGRLAFGLQGGVSFYQDKWSSLDLDEQNDPTFQEDSPTFIIPRAGFGIYYDTPTWYIGISTPQLFHIESSQLKTYNSNSLLYKHYFLTAGYLFKLNPDFKLKPSVLVKYIKNSPVQVDINANLLIKDLVWVGLSYRTGASIAGLLEWKINKQFQVGYSYDQSLTQLRKYHHGTHEFFIRYEFGFGLEAMSPRYF